MKKIKSQHIIHIPKHFFLQWRLFGFPVAFWSLLFLFHHLFGFLRIFLANKKHKAIISYLTKNYKELIDKYSNKILDIKSNIEPDSAIWVCWWDGEEAMPDIVKACYCSVKRHAGTHPVKLITKNNHSEYISIPDYIINKANDKKITLAHLSDIIRMALLAKHGGLWLDATVLVTGGINFDKIPFFTIHRDFGGEFVPKRRWVGNCMGGTNKVFMFDFIRELFYLYWEKHDVLIDYFLVDYSIALAYNLFPSTKEMIDNVPQNNKNYMFLNRNLGKEYSPNLFYETTKDTIFHKLSWKGNFQAMTSENKLTFYGYILEKDNEYQNNKYHHREF